MPPARPRRRNPWRRSSARIAVRRHELAPAVENAQTIGVAVVGDGEVEPVGAHALCRRREVLADRLGVDAAEERIARRRAASATRVDRRADDLRDQESPAAPCIASARTARPGRTDRRQVDERGEARRGRARRGRASRRVRGNGGRRRRPSDLAGDRLVHLGRRAAAEGGLDLEAVVDAGIVARRDRDTGGEAEARHVVGDGGCRDRPVGEEDVDAGQRELLGGGGGELRREEARVVADGDAALAGARPPAEPPRRGRRDAAGSRRTCSLRRAGRASRRCRGGGSRSYGVAGRPPGREGRRGAARSEPIRSRKSEARAKRKPRRARASRSSGTRGATGSSRSLPRCSRMMPAALGVARRGARRHALRCGRRGRRDRSPSRGRPARASARPADVPVPLERGPAADLAVLLAEGRPPERRDRRAPSPRARPPPWTGARARGTRGRRPAASPGDRPARTSSGAGACRCGSRPRGRPGRSARARSG